VVVVTHDEHFLRSVANRLVVFQGEQILIYEGGYDDFLKDVGWEDGGAASEISDKKVVEVEKKLSKKEQRQLRAEYNKQKKALLGPIEKKIEALESSIEKTETTLGGQNQKMIEASEKQDNAAISELARKMGAARKNIQNSYDEMDAALEELEKASEAFEKEFGNPETTS